MFHLENQRNSVIPHSNSRTASETTAPQDQILFSCVVHGDLQRVLHIMGPLVCLSLDDTLGVVVQGIQTSRDKKRYFVVDMIGKIEFAISGSLKAWTQILSTSCKMCVFIQLFVYSGNMPLKFLYKTYIYIYIYHQVMLIPWSPLTLSLSLSLCPFHYVSLSPIALGRSSRLHPVSIHSWWI